MALRRKPVRRKLGLRRRPASGEQVAENRRAAIFYAITALGFVLLVTLGVWSRPKPVDTSGCPTNQMLPAAHTVVVIDQTDRFTPGQIDYAKKVILYEYGRLHRYDRLTVRGVGDDADAPQRKFQLCRVQKRDEVLGIAVNEDQVARRFADVAGKPLNRYLNSLAKVGEARLSPLVETIATISREDDFGEGVAARRLVVISDLAQHSGNFSQYPRQPGHDGAGRDGGGAIALPADLGPYAADLKGAVVRAHYLVRPSLRRVQGEAHQATWRAYFRRQGASDVAIGWGIGLGDNGRDGKTR